MEELQRYLNRIADLRKEYGTQDKPFQDRMGITLHNCTIHKCTRIAFISVHYDIDRAAFFFNGLKCGAPLASGWQDGVWS